MHPLWFSPLLPLLFLVSAVGLGLGMVAVETLVSSWLYRREAEWELLHGLDACGDGRSRRLLRPAPGRRRVARRAGASARRLLVRGAVLDRDVAEHDRPGRALPPLTRRATGGGPSPGARS